MLEQLREKQRQIGAKFQQEANIIESFGNDTQAKQAAKQGVCIYDRSHWGLLELGGSDRSRFLHNQTTNNIQDLQPGQGCDTVFVNSTGRTLDLVTVYLTEDAIWLLVSPHRRQFLLTWMDRYIFPMDKVELKDISENYAVFNLIGPKSSQLFSKFELNDLENLKPGNHCQISFANFACRLAGGNGLGLPGYTLIVPINEAATVWQYCLEAEAIPLGDLAWNELRIEQGRPIPDQELTEDYNPLEAGLWEAISFDKGCYIGQETIARLNTYKGVKQRLWGIKLNQAVIPGTSICLEGENIGIITSFAQDNGANLALGYIRSKAGGAGLKVQVGEATGEVLTVPYLTHEYYQPQKPN